MSKKFRIMILLTVFLFSLLGVRSAHAQENLPDFAAWSDLLLEAFAIETGKTVQVIQDYRDDGLSYREIALELGYEGEEFTDLFEQVGETVLELAVVDQLITEDESEQLSRRMKLVKTITSWLVDKFLARLGLTKEEFLELLNSGLTIRDILELQGIEPPTRDYVTTCGITREEFTALLRSGESVRNICPGLVPLNFEPTHIRPIDPDRLRP